MASRETWRRVSGSPKKGVFIPNREKPQKVEPGSNTGAEKKKKVFTPEEIEILRNTEGVGC